jgi:hypothetical protein
MHVKKLFALPLSLLFLTSACGDEEPSDGADAGVDVADPGPEAELFTTIIQPSCGGPLCHLDGDDEGGLNLDNDGALLGRLLADSSVEGVKIIVPGDPDASYFYLKLTDNFESVGGEGVRMPLGTRGLGSERLQFVRDWITALE